MAKLKADDVARLKAFIAAGYPTGELCTAFNISRMTLNRIRNGETRGRIRPSRSIPTLEKIRRRLNPDAELPAKPPPLPDEPLNEKYATIHANARRLREQQT